VSGSVLRTARLKSEHYLRLDNPRQLIHEVTQSGRRVDIITFLQNIDNPVPEFAFYHEAEKIAVLPITTYDDWFKHQLYNKPRNTLRKAIKSGIEVRLEDFSESLVEGIKSVYDESPVRQGRRNRHYHKDLETIRKEHATFLERSQFIAAYDSGAMIGFVKLTFSEGLGGVMNFLSKIGHRDKAPNNALLAKAVEVCAERHIERLVYGAWGRGGGRGLVEFKVANGFQCVDVPRYYVPLTALGRLALRAGFHANMIGQLPEGWVATAASMRERWNSWRFKAPGT
jgi:hypothetical protein